MVSTKYLLDHIDSLRRLSQEVKDRAVSAKLQEMANELRILVSVAEVANLAAALSTAPASAPATAAPSSNEMVAALYETKAKRRRKTRESAEGEAPAMGKRKVKKPAAE
jgi:CelD/BcsL family acetyltransferase involved in cellulose biosynthesis